MLDIKYDSLYYDITEDRLDLMPFVYVEIIIG